MRRLLLCLALTAGASVRADALDDALRGALESSHIPGASVAVARQGQIVKVGSYGLAHVEDGAPVRPETRFEIASISKGFVGAAIRLLADEGALDLEAPLSRFFEVPETWRDIRLRHLVAMSSGLPEDWDLIPWGDVRDQYDDGSMLARFRSLQLVSTVGKRWNYSGPGYAMLAMIVARVSGMPYARFVAERLLRPAGLTETGFNDPAAVVQNRAEGYRLDRDGRTLLRGFYVAPYLHARPDTGMFSTARDLVRWVLALEAGKIVTAPERLFTPFHSDDGSVDLGYGYGWATGIRGGHRVTFHTGGFRTGFKAILLRFPDDGVVVALTTNGRGTGDAVFDALGTVLELPDLTRPTGTDPDPLRTKTLISDLAARGTGAHPHAVLASDASVYHPELLAEFVARKSQPEFVSYHALKRPVPWHGQALVDVVTLRYRGPEDALYVSCYRDRTGRVHDVELTFR